MLSSADAEAITVSSSEDPRERFHAPRWDRVGIVGAALGFGAVNAGDAVPVIELSARRHANSRRQLQLALLLGVLATGMCLGVAVVHAYDTRLDEALAALQKAAAPVEASSAGEVSPHTKHKFDNEFGKALASIQNTMEHITRR